MKRLNTAAGARVWILATLLLVAMHCAAAKSASVGRPEDVVRRLYRQVVKRRPLGLPMGSDRTAIWPFLSKGLIHRIEVAQACQTDEVRQARKEGEKLHQENPSREAQYSSQKPLIRGWNMDCFLVEAKRLFLLRQQSKERRHKRTDPLTCV